MIFVDNNVDILQILCQYIFFVDLRDILNCVSVIMNAFAIGKGLDSMRKLSAGFGSHSVLALNL